jgi:hypothetical protein
MRPFDVALNKRMQWESLNILSCYQRAQKVSKIITVQTIKFKVFIQYIMQHVMVKHITLLPKPQLNDEYEMATVAADTGVRCSNFHMLL